MDLGSTSRDLSPHPLNCQWVGPKNYKKSLTDFYFMNFNKITKHPRFFFIFFCNRSKMYVPTQKKSSLETVAYRKKNYLSDEHF